MNYKKNREILELLLSAETSGELKKIIETESFFNGCVWVLYGGEGNHTGVIDGQMREANNALMEKITNSIDAILMRKCLEEGIDPRDKKVAPRSMVDAINRYFGGKEKLRRKRANFAQEWLRITAEGKKESPTITVIDKGEGQQPNQIKETILSLGKEIKEKISFVYGTYNQGGSSPLGYAGDPKIIDENYLQLVLARRPDQINDTQGDKNYNHYGFTIVRKIFDKDKEKFIYEYFVEKDTKDIFSFPPDRPIVTKDKKFEFREGCLVKLYDYQIKEKGNIVFRGLNEFIEKKLLDSPLPIYLKELRNYGGGTDYTIFGLKEKMRKKTDIHRNGYPQLIPVDLGEIGKRNIEVFILEHKANLKEKISVDSYLEQKEKIFFIKDGLVLHTENASWLRNDCDLQDLCHYLFVFIDISTINPAIAQMLHSGREKFKNNATTLEVLQRLKVYLTNENFKEIDKEYGNLTIGSDSDMKDKNLRKQMMKEVEKDIELKEYFDIGEDVPLDEGEGDKPKSPYEGSFLPEKFDLVSKDPNDIFLGTHSKITFDTGAEDRLFERTDDRGEYDWSESEKFHVAFHSYKKGRLTFRIDPKNVITAPAEDVIMFYLRVPTKNIEFSKPVTLLLKQKEPYKGAEFPSIFKLSKEILKVPVGGSRKLVLKTDVENKYFIRKKNKGTIELSEIKNLKYGQEKLKDGFLSIKVEHSGKKIEELDNIKIKIFDKAGHKFNVESPVKIIPSHDEPELKLPEPKKIYQKDWGNDFPKWTIEDVGRIQTWKKLKTIKINIDSWVFEELNKISLPNKALARDKVFEQIYINAIWFFLELKDIDITINNNSNASEIVDPKDYVFNKAIRASAKNVIHNIKKLIR